MPFAKIKEERNVNQHAPSVQVVTTAADRDTGTTILTQIALSLLSVPKGDKVKKILANIARY